MCTTFMHVQVWVVQCMTVPAATGWLLRPLTGVKIETYWNVFVRTVWGILTMTVQSIWKALVKEFKTFTAVTGVVDEKTC
jgi:hypothetical protein